MFKNPFSFNGRIRRKEYGLSYLACIIALPIIIEIGSLGNTFIIAFILIIPLSWFMLAQSARRCHDIGNNGWHQFRAFYWIKLFYIPGNVGDNEYGPDPKIKEEPDYPIDMIK